MLSILNSFNYFFRILVDEYYELFFYIFIVEGDIFLVLDSEVLLR